VSNDGRHPFTGTDLAPERKGFQARTVKRASAELWPDGVPGNVAIRNRMLWGWYRQMRIPPRWWPSERHLRRLFLAQ
jgi:hypothetical protein